MRKILLHLSSENEYRSFVKALVNNTNDQFQIVGNVVHGTLFDTSYKLKPSIVILPTNEYTQEFHDYITEYYKSIKIILFTNNIVANTNIINFWNQTKTTLVSKKEWYPEQQPANLVAYDELYDNETYRCLGVKRNDKTAVYLSNDDDKNHKTLDKYLYPNTSHKLVLFNSATFKHPQNVGLLTAEDSCRVLNSYECLVDIDNRFSLEASACGIDNISTEGDLYDNITRKIHKPKALNLDDKSYSNFITQSFLPILS